MRRLIAAFVVLAFAAGPALAASCPLPEGAAGLMAEAGAAVNAERKANGRRPLARAPQLDEAAQAHACWMARHNVFSHQGENGSLPMRRISSTGYVTRLTAENIAWGQKSGGEVVDEWMNSQGHWRNILLGEIAEYGVGVAVMNGRLVWVMDYAAH